MRLGIIAAGGTKYSDFCKIIEDFVVRNQIFIFTLVCGMGSLAEKWGKENGASLEYFIGDIDGFVDTIDYGILVDCYCNQLNQSNQLKNIAMKMKIRGKHGELIRISGG